MLKLFSTIVGFAIAASGFAVQFIVPNDVQLAECRDIVVGYWPKAPRVHHIGPIDEDGWTTEREIHTEIVVERVIKGDLKPGRYPILLPDLPSWEDDGTTTVPDYSLRYVPPDVSNVTERRLWFLNPVRSWDEADKTIYLEPRTIRGIQELKFEPLYRALFSPNRKHEALKLLTETPDDTTADRVMSFLYEWRKPWPYEAPRPVIETLPTLMPGSTLALAKVSKDLRHRGRTRGLALALLSRSRIPDIVPLARSFLKDPNPEVRLVAVGLLALSKDEKSYGEFRQALDTGAQSGDPLNAVLTVIASLDVPSLAPVLIQFLETDGDYWTVQPSVTARNILYEWLNCEFPFNIKHSLEAWQRVERIASSSDRAQALKSALGPPFIPIRCLLTSGPIEKTILSHSGWNGEMKSLPAEVFKYKIKVTNVTSQPVTILRRPQLNGFGPSHVYGPPLKRDDFVTIPPGQSYEYWSQITTLMGASIPDLFWLNFEVSGQALGLKGWMGTAPVEVQTNSGGFKP